MKNVGNRRLNGRSGRISLLRLERQEGTLLSAARAISEPKVRFRKSNPKSTTYDGTDSPGPHPPIHLPPILLLPPILQPTTEPANAPLPAPQMVPPDPTLLQAPPHLQAIPRHHSRHAFIQERCFAEKAQFERRMANCGLDDEG